MLDMTSLKKWSLLVPTTIIPLLYLVGYFYQEGYLSAFALDNSFFPLTLPEYMMQTFYVVLSLVSYLFTQLNNNLSYLFYLAVALVVTGLFMTWFDPHQPQVARTLRHYLRQQRFKMLWIPALMGLAGIIGFYLLLLVIGLMALLPLGAYTYGEKIARGQIADFNNCQNLQTLPTDLRCVVVMENRDRHTGMLIARSATHIAIWSGDEAEMFETAGKQLQIMRGKAEKKEKQQERE